MITRGIKKEVDDFINQLIGKWLPYKHNKNSTDDQIVQLAVRPIQLWEIVFPREHKDVVLTTILGKDKCEGTYEGYGGGKETQHKKHDKFLWGLRKMLGVKKIDKWDGSKELPTTRDHIETVGIGIKEDYEDADGYEQL